jgi:hypothetical protein
MWAASLELARESRLETSLGINALLKKASVLDTAVLPVKFLTSPRRSKTRAAAADGAQARSLTAPSTWSRSGDEKGGATDEAPSPQKSEDVREYLAACAIQKRVRGIQLRTSMGIGVKTQQERAGERQRKLTKQLIDKDKPSLGGRTLDLQEQEDLSSIKIERALKRRTNPHSQTDEAGPVVRGRRLDDNVTLPMNAFSLAKTTWLLALFDYLCVRTDPDGRRTSKIGEGEVSREILDF